MANVVESNATNNDGNYIPKIKNSANDTSAVKNKELKKSEPKYDKSSKVVTTSKKQKSDATTSTTPTPINGGAAVNKQLQPSQTFAETSAAP